MSRNKINQILTLYLRKWQVYIHYVQTNYFGDPNVLAVSVGGQACINVYHKIGMWQVSEGKVGGIIKG